MKWLVNLVYFIYLKVFWGKKMCKELEDEQLTQGIASNDSSVSLNNFQPIIWLKKKSQKEGAEAYIAQMILYPTDSRLHCVCVCKGDVVYT